MLVKGKADELEMKDFFDYTSNFFVVLYKGDLTFINRTTNTSANRAFGAPRGFLCPGSLHVTKFVKSILEFIRCLDVTVTKKKDISFM